MKKRVLIALLVAVVILLAITSAAAAYMVNAVYHSHSGTITPTGGTIAEAVATPDDGKFVQLAPLSWIILRFPGHEAAVPDGTSAADLRVDTYDVPYQADSEVLVSLDGLTWISMGVHPDTANIDLDLNGTGPVKYVKVDQANHYIDPAYPSLGFDLDAVVALNAGTLPYGEITSPGVDEVIFGPANFEALYYDDDPGIVQWAVRYGTCAAATNTVFGNVDGYNDPYSWDGHSFQATADTSSWTPGHYCFVFNPKEEAGETDIRLTRWFTVGQLVDIDIKPGSYPNCINLGSKGVIPIAILSSDTFDATQVDPGTVTLGGAEVAVRGKGNKSLAHHEDVNGDGLLDLVMQVETENLDPGLFQDGFATLTGNLYPEYDGTPIEGSTSICIVPPE